MALLARSWVLDLRGVIVDSTEVAQLPTTVDCDKTEVAGTVKVLDIANGRIHSYSVVSQLIVINAEKNHGLILSMAV